MENEEPTPAAGELSEVELIALCGVLEEKHECCPMCGEDYIGADATKGGTILFIHEELGASADGCSDDADVFKHLLGERDT